MGLAQAGPRVGKAGNISYTPDRYHKGKVATQHLLGYKKIVGVNTRGSYVN